MSSGWDSFGKQDSGSFGSRQQQISTILSSLSFEEETYFNRWNTIALELTLHMKLQWAADTRTTSDVSGPVESIYIYDMISMILEFKGFYQIEELHHIDAFR